jgi:hypothetical protein
MSPWTKPTKDKRQLADLGRCKLSIGRRNMEGPEFYWNVSLKESTHPGDPVRYFSVGSGTAETADRARAGAFAWAKRSDYCD